MLKTINEIITYSVKIQRSDFYSFLYPISNVIDIKEILSKHSDRYKDASHNCYAYIIGKNQDIQYYSDQGEPSGTAGKPILNVLLKHHLTNILAIVTRYFGGVKLGVRGLIDAYSLAVEGAIESQSLIDYIELNKLVLTCDYSTWETLKHTLKQYDIVIEPLEFTDNVRLEISYPDKFHQEINKYLDDLKQRRLIIN